MVELNVLRSPGKEECTRIAFYQGAWLPGLGSLHRMGEGAGGTQPRRLVTVDYSCSSTLPDVLPGAGDGPVFLGAGEP